MADETLTNEEGIPLEHVDAAVQTNTEVIFKEIEVSKLNLKENDVLVVKMQGMDMDQSMMSSLQNHFKKVFPNNKVLVFSLSADSVMGLEVVQADLTEKSCDTAPKGYCEGCNCGKKSAAEAMVQQSSSETALQQMPSASVPSNKIAVNQKVRVIEDGHAVQDETGTIESYIGGGFYLVKFDNIGVIKLRDLSIEEIKGA